MGAPERRVHPAVGLDDVQLEKTIARSSGRREDRGRSMEETSSLGVWANGIVHLHRESDLVPSPACQNCDIPRNKSRTGGSVGRASSRYILRSDIGIAEGLEDGKMWQAVPWFIYGNMVICMLIVMFGS